jgi:lysine-specific demethylase/histidyl-hydroxylase NO66
MLDIQKDRQPCASFSRLLGDATSSFFSTVYEQDFLHVSRRSPDYFHGLFSIRDAEEVLWNHEPHMREFVRFHNDGKDVVAPSDIGPLDTATWAFAQYGNGTTIIINALENYHLRLAQFVRDLEIFLEARVSVAAYLTPTGARAFRVHFDTHDVLIAQIEGSKTYDLFLDNTTPALPLKRQQTEIAAENLDNPIATITLNGGDVLYIPRGMVHVAKTHNDRSLHLTFSMHPPKVSDLASIALELAAESNPDLRSSLFKNNGESGLSELIDALGKVLGAPLTLDSVLDRQRQRFIGRLRPLPSRRLESGLAASALHRDDWLEKSDGSVCSIVTASSVLHLGFPGLGIVRNDDRLPTRLEMPAALEEAIRFIEKSQVPFQVFEIPDSLSESSKLMLARYLLREGLLQVAQKGV